MSQILLLGQSPSSRVYIPSFLPLQASNNSVIAFPTSLGLKLEFRLMLEQTGNRSVFNQAKKAIYRRWLKNPNGEVEGITANKRNKDCCNRYKAINHFQLD